MRLENATLEVDYSTITYKMSDFIVIYIFIFGYGVIVKRAMWFDLKTRFRQWDGGTHLVGCGYVTLIFFTNGSGICIARK